MIKIYNSVEDLRDHILSEYYYKDPKGRWEEKFQSGMKLVESVECLPLEEEEKRELAREYSAVFYRVDQIRLFKLLEKAFGKHIIVQEELDV